jgi:hypothetical protein
VQRKPPCTAYEEQAGPTSLRHNSAGNQNGADHGQAPGQLGEFLTECRPEDQGKAQGRDDQPEYPLNGNDDDGWPHPEIHRIGSTPGLFWRMGCHGWFKVCRIIKGVKVFCH